MKMYLFPELEVSVQPDRIWDIRPWKGASPVWVNFPKSVARPLTTYLKKIQAAFRIEHGTPEIGGGWVFLASLTSTLGCGDGFFWREEFFDGF